VVQLTTEERLQPSLLERLTDDEPERKTESRDKRVLPMARFRASVIRDLGWLLNTAGLDLDVDLGVYPELGRSVLNYGVRNLTGLSASGVDVAAVERGFREAIINFEPRILKETLKVTAVLERDRMNRNALSFQIEGELWADPAPLHLLLKTEVDFDTGKVRVADTGGR